MPWTGDVGGVGGGAWGTRGVGRRGEGAEQGGGGGVEGVEVGAVGALPTTTRPPRRLPCSASLSALPGASPPGRPVGAGTTGTTGAGGESDVGCRGPHAAAGGEPG